ncbi:MAG: ATP-dependent 6-phosphofructokinase [Endomicrobiaceae bacterium]|nr:ATP-dependent 6-phosphofructokinase [Endomicrobiaceae bacterium]
MANKKIGIITSGGDAPGMNAAVRSVVRTGIYSGFDIVGFKRGFKGLLDGEYQNMTVRSVSGTINLGGTILHTGRCPEMKTSIGLNKAVKIIKEMEFEGLVIIGGDGSLAAGNALSKHGIKVISIPASIDNDVFGTDETIGYDTALNTAVEAIDKIRDTANSHDRVFVVEIMGREHGFLTLSVGIASGVELIVVPEVKLDRNALYNELRQGFMNGKTSLIIAFAEGCGNSGEFGNDIAKNTGLDVRVSNLGYIQRGGTPTARTRILASIFGAHAVKLLKDGKSNLLVGITDGKISYTPVEVAINSEKTFDIETYNILRKLSI